MTMNYSFFGSEGVDPALWWGTIDRSEEWQRKSREEVRSVERINGEHQSVSYMDPNQ